MTAVRPRILLIYYTYTQQTLKVIEAMAGVLRERGCEVRQARIEFTDPSYADRFSRFPLRYALLDLLGMLPAQLRRAIGEIRIPEEAREGEYDLHWLADLVADLHADRLLHEIRGGSAAAQTKARRRLRGMPAILAQ